MRIVNSQNLAAPVQLAEIEKLLANLQTQGVNLPADFQNMSPTEQLDWAKQMSDLSQKTQETTQTMNAISDAAKQTATSTTAARKIFNLRKAQLELAEPLDNSGLDDPVSGLNFKDYSDLKAWLDTQDRQTASSSLTSFVPTGADEQMESYMESYYEHSLNDNEKLDVAKLVWELLPNAVKAKTNVEGVIEAPYKDANPIVAAVAESNQIIKKLAEQSVKSSKSFNMKRFAQHKTVENVVMYGPGAVRVDPFLRQPVSDWSIVERNKGFGLVVDDVWNIDWESIWRGSVMDKYSRPYRDKDGNWVGGYIQKRFEVDKWVPEENNMQLKPGQLRKDYDPAKRSLEARLEAMREKEAESRGYAPASEGKPFNWKEASSKKKVTAQLPEPRRPKGSEYFEGPKKKLSPTYTCTNCGGTMAADSVSCPNCGTSINQAVNMGLKLAPDQKGKQNNPYSQPIAITPNTALASVSKKRTPKQYLSEEFKQMSDPFDVEGDSVDNSDVEKSCEDLAIDG